MNKREFSLLPFSKKIRFVLHKYGWEAIFTLYLVTLLGSWIYLDYFVEEPVLSVEMIDGEPDSPNFAAFMNFMEEEGYPCTDQSVQISKLIQLGDGSHEVCCDPWALITCKAKIGRTDIYFWDDSLVEDTILNQDLADLRQILPQAVLESLGDRVVYSAPLLRKGYPCAIRLTNSDWIAENGFYQECTVGVSQHVKDPELIAAFLQYII